MDFCVASSSIWQLAGYLLYVLKVLVPIIIIVLGIIDLTKALVASKDDALNTAIRSLLLRFIIGFAIFFVPLIISTLFTLIKDASPYIAKADACQICLLRPLSKGCGNYKTEAKNYRETQKENLNKPNSEGYKTEKEACYFCGSGYVWTSNGKGCQKVDKNIETDQIINNSALCEAMNEGNLDFNHTDNSNQDSTWTATGDHLKFYNALSVLHSGQIEEDNTIALFQKAGEANFYAAECDLRSDGTNLYCSHKTDLSNATKFVDYLNVCKKYKMVAVLDIKWASSYDLIADYIKNNNLQQSVIVQTGSMDVIKKISARVSNVKYWYLVTDNAGYGTFNNSYTELKSKGVVSVNISANVATESIIKDVKNHGFKVCVYSIDGDNARQTYSDYGADYIMTNLVS